MTYDEWENRTHRRYDRQGLVEHFCEHGVGHPNPGSALWIAQQQRGSEPLSRDDIASRFDAEMVHGCDGCCGDEGFPTFRDSLMRSHEIIMALQESLKYLKENPNGIRSSTCTRGSTDHHLDSK